MTEQAELPWRKGKRVAVVGAGPGGVSAALALLKKGFDVRVYERNSEPKPLGGAVLLSVPVLAVLRDYGIPAENFGAYTKVEFCKHNGKVRADLPFNKKVEDAFGIRGWHYGVLRSDAFGKMMALLPEGVIVPDSEFKSYTEIDDVVQVEFANGKTVEADILVGADGIRSGVSAQAFGEPDLFHVGLRVWLAWCEKFDGPSEHIGRISHRRKDQASFFPMLHNGKPGYEWWVVEPVKENAPQPENVEAYIRNIVNQYADPLPQFPDHTDFDSQIFCWDIYNRPSMKKWSRGRVVCLGDAVHPVSPYAAYGMGMAIEDGYFIAKFLDGVDLEEAEGVTGAFEQYEETRVKYVNHQVEFARKLGNIFHKAPYPLAMLRDLIFDHTPLLRKMIAKDYLATAEDMSLSMEELHVK